MKKLCFVMLQFKMGGCERVFCSLASIMSTPIYLFTIKTDYDIRMLNELPNNVHLISVENIKLIRTLIKWQRYKLLSPILRLIVFVLRALYLYFKLSMRRVCFINFSDTLSSLLFVSLMSHLCLTSSNISWVHCNPLMLKQSRCFVLYKYLLCCCKRVVCICKEQKNELLKLIPNLVSTKVVVLYNAINLAKVQQKAKDSVPPITTSYLLMVSRIDLRSKDFFMLIDAYSALPVLLRHMYPLYIIGDGEDKDKVQQYINDKNLSKEIILYGSDANPFRWMWHCSLFIFTSKSEGFPTVLLEAMACGAVIISTKCLTGPSEILENGKNGILIPVGNVQILTEKMLEALSQSFDRKFYIKNSQQRVRDFDIVSISQQIKNLNLFDV